jgi:hypothetical protein
MAADFSVADQQSKFEKTSPWKKVDQEIFCMEKAIHIKTAVFVVLFAIPGPDLGQPGG